MIQEGIDSQSQGIIGEKEKEIMIFLCLNYLILRIRNIQIDIIWTPQLELFLSIREKKDMWKTIRLIGKG